MKSGIDDKYIGIFKILKDNGLVRVFYDSIYLNLSLSELQILYLPIIAYFDQVVFEKRYKLFYLNEYIGKITFIKDPLVVTGIRCRVILNPSSIYYNDMHEAILKCPLGKPRNWGVLDSGKK